jgi:hypothetical protein
VKVAVGILGIPERNLKRETIDRVGYELVKLKIVDIKVIVCETMWLLSGTLRVRTGRIPGRTRPVG